MPKFGVFFTLNLYYYLKSKDFSGKTDVISDM